MLPGCYPGVTRVLPGCYPGVIRVLPSVTWSTVYSVCETTVTFSILDEEVKSPKSKKTRKNCQKKQPENQEWPCVKDEAIIDLPDEYELYDFKNPEQSSNEDESDDDVIDAEWKEYGELLT